MNATQWQRVQSIVEQAAALPAGERTRLVAAETGDEPELRQEIEGMLRSFDATGSFFEDAIGRAATSVVAGKELSAGDRIGTYRITSRIGHGGMGVVYLAKRDDEQYQQRVAIKVVRAGWGPTEELFSRFRAERQILAAINHPNISRLIDGGITDEGLPFLVMEFVEGVALDQWIAANSPPLHVRLDLFRKLCLAIQYAHQNLIVHRDLKPGNILVTADGAPKLLDFGIAKLLDTEVVSGQNVVFTRPAERLMTPEYASPEQIRGQAITTATDVYGLGVLLYEILTGTRPFHLRNLSPGEVERIVCETQPPPPSSVGLSGRKADGEAPTEALPRVKHRRSTDLDRIVLKAMHKSPLRRYPSAADLAADVQRYQEGFPVSARPDSFAYRSTKFLQRNKLASATTVLFFLTVIALSVVSLVQARRARREAAAADAVANYLTSLFQFTRPDATQGRSVSARDILDRGTNQLNTEWKGDPSIKARLLNTLGNVYEQIGDLDRAAALLQQAQGINRSLGLATSSESAEAAIILGDVFVQTGNYAEAERQYLSALDVQTKVHGRKSAEVAEALDGLGHLYWTTGDFARAESYDRQAIAIAERISPPTDENLLTYRNNLEVILADAGEYSAAQPIARDLLDIRRRTFGDINSNTGSSMNNFAFLLFKIGRLREGKQLYEETLAMRHKLYGAEHPEIAMSLVSLGYSEFVLGNCDKARPLLTEGLQMAEKLEGEASLDTAFDEDLLGLLLLQEGELPAARQQIEKALVVRLGKTPPPPSRLAESYDHLGLVELAEGRLPDARAKMEKALNLRRSFYKTENDSFAESYVHLGRLELAAGQPAKAEEDFQHATSLAQGLFGKVPHPIKAEALKGLSLSEGAQGRQAQSKSDLEAAKDMQEVLGMEQTTAGTEQIIFNNII